MTMNRVPSQPNPKLPAVQRFGAGLLVLLATSGVCIAGGCGNTSMSTPAGVSNTGGPLVARGRTLDQADGCVGCHSLDGTRLTGPSWKGLADSRVELSNGKTVIASDAYLTRHIVEPNALTVQGYPGQVMSQAIESLALKHRPADVRALVAFIDSLK